MYARSTPRRPILYSTLSVLPNCLRADYHAPRSWTAGRNDAVPSVPRTDSTRAPHRSARRRRAGIRSVATPGKMGYTKYKHYECRTKVITLCSHHSETSPDFLLSVRNPATSIYGLSPIFPLFSLRSQPSYFNSWSVPDFPFVTRCR